MADTSRAEDFTSWLHSERGIITQLEVFFVLSVLLHAVEVVLGWWRRCSTNAWYLKYSLWLAYTINPTLVIYTLGLARASPPSAASELLQACAFPFVMALGSTNSMTVYSIDDNKQFLRHFVQQLLRVLSLFAMWKANKTILTSSTYYLVPLMYLFFSVLLLSVNGGRIYASMTASSFLDKQSRYVQLRMKTEHIKSTRCNPVTLTGYKYPFYEDDYHLEETIVTLDKVWCSYEGPLGSSDGQLLKEACLSFSLFRLLRRRFFGLPCPESKIKKTRDLVLNGLLRAEENYEAAYRVIEAELAFAHDHFFTSSASFNTKFGNAIILLSIAKTVIYPVTILGSIRGFIHSKNKISSDSTGTVVGGGFDPIVTALVLMVVLIALELLQIYLYFSSDWAKVKLVRRSIYFFAEERRRWSIQSIFFHLGLDRYCNRLPRVFGYWKNKIGQHALLKDLHRRSYIADVMGGMSGFIFNNCLEFHPVFSRGMPGIKGPYHIQLTSEVKLAVARTLKATKGHLSNGASSLQWNKQSRLSWAFDQSYHTNTMLIWHVATEYCDIARTCGGNKEVDGSVISNRIISTALSSYCAYLMAFVPELLPDEELDTRITFREVRREAHDMLSEDMTLHEKYRTMKTCSMQPSDDDDEILIKGIKLGRKLEEIGDGVRWKTLADFWTEMVLYIAPSDNAKAHIERLANGGEFLTHLWALLFHAGILDREKE